MSEEIDIHDAARVSDRTVASIYMMRRRCPGRFPDPIRGGGKRGRKDKLFWRYADVVEFAKKDPPRER